MFNYFHKKEPEKPKPNFIGEQHEHKQCIVVYAGSRAYDNLKLLQADKITVVQKKEQTRIQTMINSCEEISVHHHRVQCSALSKLQTAKSQGEYMAMQLGFIQSPSEGLMICPGCLQQAIVACEEVLISLKDIQQATKEYV